jgi:putative flippase GtrA
MGSVTTTSVLAPAGTADAGTHHTDHVGGDRPRRDRGGDAEGHGPIIGWVRSELIARMARSMAVSVATTALSAAVLVALTSGAVGIAAGTANVVATLCGIGPSLAWNRRYEWRRPGRGDLRREVLPFWGLSLTGLVLSTVAVDRVASATASWSDAVRTVALPATNVAVFASLWLVQFAILDRLVFAGPTRRDGGSASAGGHGLVPRRAARDRRDQAETGQGGEPRHRERDLVAAHGHHHAEQGGPEAVGQVERE